MAEASTFYLEIITPERQFYIGPAEALVFPAVDGEMGVYPGHEPAVTAVEPGELRYKVDGKWEPAAVGAGFVEIKPDYVILLVGFAEHPEEIDRKRAEAARERAEERLRQKQSIHEYYHSKAALARAMARLKTRRESYSLPKKIVWRKGLDFTQNCHLFRHATCHFRGPPLGKVFRQPEE